MTFSTSEQFISYSSDFAGAPKRARVHFATPEAFTGARYDGDSPSSSENGDQAPSKENLKARELLTQKNGIRQEAVGQGVWDDNDWAASRRYGYVGRKARKLRVKVRKLVNCLWTGRSSASGE